MSTFLAQLLSEPAIHIATDINRYACLATAKTGAVNNVSLALALAYLGQSGGDTVQSGRPVPTRWED